MTAVPLAPVGARTAVALTGLVVASTLALVPSAAHAAIGVPVPLGDASSFAVLAGAGVTNTGATTLSGDIGSFATATITGAGTITMASGVNRGGDAVTQQAKTDLVTAYGAASAQTPDPLGGVELGGLTLEPGVYDTGGVIELDGTLTLDANGDPDAVFVFQSLSTLVTGSASSVAFIDGATACNVYWRVPTSATIGAGSRFAGTILAEQTITFDAGATLEGRALAQSGQVTMINNTITVPTCTTDLPVVPVPTPSVPLTPRAAPTDQVVAPTDDATAPQVAVRPRGGVATGDGSSLGDAAGSGTIVAPALAALVALGAGSWGLLRARRSRRR